MCSQGQPPFLKLELQLCASVVCVCLCAWASMSGRESAELLIRPGQVLLQLSWLLKFRHTSVITCYVALQTLSGPSAPLGSLVIRHPRR